MKIAAGAEWQKSDDNIVQIQIVPGHSINLNAVGSLIWIAISQGKQESEIADLLVAEFDVPPDTARADVTAFLETLEENLLLER